MSNWGFISILKYEKKTTTTNELFKKEIVSKQQFKSFQWVYWAFEVFHGVVWISGTFIPSHLHISINQAEKWQTKMHNSANRIIKIESETERTAEMQVI